MSKQRDKTTGVPTPAKRAAHERKYKSRAERESEINRLVLIATAALTALVVLILGGAWLIDGVIRPNQAVASVGGQSIVARDFERRVRFERYSAALQIIPYLQFYGTDILNNQQSPVASLWQDLRIPTLMGQRTLDKMVDNLVIQQYARENNIALSDEEIDAKIYEFFRFEATPMTATPTTTPTITTTPLVSPTPTNTPTPTLEPSFTPTMTSTPFPTGVPTATPGPTERFETFSDDKQTYLNEAARLAGLTEAEVRAIFAEEALRDKVLKAVMGELPKTQEQVRARHILLKTREDADTVLQALQNGESFGDLARALSEDPGSKASGGELGWVGKGIYVPEFDEAVWAAEVGTVIGPIDTTANGANFGFHIIQVQGREERPLTESEASSVRDNNFLTWLTDQRTARSAQTYDTVWREWASSKPTLEELGLSGIQ